MVSPRMLQFDKNWKEDKVLEAIKRKYLILRPGEELYYSIN
jgi:hypothetical protein